MSGATLGTLVLTWYNYIDPDMTVEACNYLQNRAAAEGWLDRAVRFWEKQL